MARKCRKCVKHKDRKCRGKRCKLWIRHAIKKPGALTKTVIARYGKAGFTDEGTIKGEVLRRLAKVEGTTGKRARLAMTLRRLRR